MNLHTDEDHPAAQDAVRAFCADHFDLVHVASRAGQPVPDGVWRGLGELKMLVEVSDVGLTEATFVFEELGAHLLPDMYVRAEVGRSAVRFAGNILARSGVDEPEGAVATAKILAGGAARCNGRAAVQIFGGTGFTWDVAPHYFLKRGWALEHVFGTSSWHASRVSDIIGDEVDEEVAVS
jgi:hypothetical protein